MTDLFDMLTASDTANLPASANQSRYQPNMLGHPKKSVTANHRALILPPISSAQQQQPRRTLIQWQILLTTSKGKLIWFQYKQKTAPDITALNQ
ncbi:MAG: hypothetical protein ACOYL2_13105, partial [Burkholderiaceae bacterium]